MSKLRMIKAIKVSLCFRSASQIGLPVCTAFIKHLLNGIESVIDEVFRDNYLLAWQTPSHSACVSQLMAVISQLISSGQAKILQRRGRERRRGRFKYNFTIGISQLAYHIFSNR